VVLRQLEYLVVLAGERHFARAAAACHRDYSRCTGLQPGGEEHPGPGLAQRGLRRRPPAVPPGPGHGVQELLRRAEGQVPAHGRTPVHVAEGHRQSVRFTANARWSIAPGQDSAGRYFASFVVDTDGSEILPESPGAIGIDLGPEHFAVLSDGRKIDSPRFLRRAEKKLKREQQRPSRKTKGSSNRTKAD
jgi:hypothetical protein